MKAIYFEQHGDSSVLRYADLPVPIPRPGEVLIKVRAVALNHLDIWVRRGWEGLHLEMPHITGSDVVGEIVSVNSDSTWKAGERVIINPGIITSEDEWTRRGQDSLSPGYKILGEQLRGGLAEFVTVPLSAAFKAPENVADEGLAAPLLVGTTCWRMLFARAQVKPGETVLIVGSGGGVNSLSILMCRTTGVTVIALAGGTHKCDKARELGAEHVIDYLETPQWHLEVLRHTKGRGVDVVVDNCGYKTMPKSLRALTRGGRLVTVGNTTGFDLNLDNRLIFTKQLSIIGSTMGSRQDFLDALQFILKHNIKIPIDRVESLSEGIRMIQYLEEGKQFGKIVLKP